MATRAGGFGSGSAFAMEDSWTLARAIEYARSIKGSDASPSVVAEALRVFDAIRKPYYKAMYAVSFSQLPRFMLLITMPGPIFENRKRKSSRRLDGKSMSILIAIYVNDLQRTAWGQSEERGSWGSCMEMTSERCARSFSRLNRRGETEIRSFR